MMLPIDRPGSRRVEHQTDAPPREAQRNVREVAG